MFFFIDKQTHSFNTFVVLNIFLLENQFLKFEFFFRFEVRLFLFVWFEALLFADEPGSDPDSEPASPHGGNSKGSTRGMCGEGGLLD